MRDRLQCEFFLVRYVPDVVKGEFVNIGVVLRQAGETADVLVRFTRDWSRVRCLDAHADVHLMESLEGEIGGRLRSGIVETKPVLQVLEDTLSNSLQLSPAGACLAENMATEMEQLLAMYVDPIKVRKERRKSGRAAILGGFRREFERAGVWGMMRRGIAASIYTRPGDSMRIDCGYRSNGSVRMFQAVSLEGELESAKVLAYSALGLREGVRRVEGAGLHLTAVVEPLRSLHEVDERLDDEATERYRFGVEAMEREDIRVVTMNDVSRMAETAKRELGI